MIQFDSDCLEDTFEHHRQKQELSLHTPNILAFEQTPVRLMYELH